MARINCFEPISLRIESMPAGEVFIISDFFDLAGDVAIRKGLSRLENDGTICRIIAVFMIVPRIINLWLNILSQSLIKSLMRLHEIMDGLSCLAEIPR